MSNSIESDLNQQADIFLAQRAVEPDASGLAEQIIFASQNMPQEITKPVSRSVWHNGFRQIFTVRLFSTKSFVFTGAIACLMLVVMSGVWFTPQTGIVKPQLLTQNISVEGDTLSEEFSWDSLLIMQDELAFAGL